MLRFFVLLICIGWGVCSYSGQKSQSFVSQLLLEPKNSKEWNENLALIQSWKKHQLSCEKQLKDQLAPLSCYALINLELKKGLLSEVEWRKKINFLDRLCFKNKDQRDVGGFKNESHISSFCQKQLEKQDKIKSIRQSIHRPQEFFNTRHK